MLDGTYIRTRGAGKDLCLPVGCRGRHRRCAAGKSRPMRSHFLPYQCCFCSLRLLFCPPPLFRQACGGPKTRIPIGFHHDLSNHSQWPLVDSTSKSSVGEVRLPNEIHIHPEVTLGCLMSAHVWISPLPYPRGKSPPSHAPEAYGKAGDSS